MQLVEIRHNILRYISLFNLTRYNLTRYKLTRYNTAFAAILFALVLAGCSGGEGRQARYFDAAQKHFDNQRYDKALIEVKNVLQINSNHVAGRYLLAQLYEQDKNWQQMFANLNLVVDLEPSHIAARTKLAL